MCLSKVDVANAREASNLWRCTPLRKDARACENEALDWIPLSTVRRSTFIAHLAPGSLDCRKQQALGWCAPSWAYMALGITPALGDLGAPCCELRSIQVRKAHRTPGLRSGLELWATLKDHTDKGEVPGKQPLPRLP